MFYALLTIFAAAVAAVDQWTKVLAQQYLTGTTVTIIPGWLQLHYITNDGMALSLFRGGRWMFVALTAVYLAVVVWAIAKKHIYKKPELWCLAAITGGAIGNLIDRVQVGASCLRSTVVTQLRGVSRPAWPIPIGKTSTVLLSGG